jgi:diguanylate cyclase (GGDEF)-like protein
VSPRDHYRTGITGTSVAAAVQNKSAQTEAVITTDASTSAQPGIDDTTLITGVRRAPPGRLRQRLQRLVEPHVIYPAITLLVLAVIWIVTVDLIRIQRANVRAAAQAAALDRVNTFQAQVLRAVREIDQTLKLVGYAYPQSSPPGSQAAGAALSGLHSRGLLPADLLFVVSIVDGNGAVLASTRPAASRTAGASAGLLAALRARDAIWVDQARVDPGSGDWMVQFARRLTARDGSFVGAAVVGVDASYFVSGYDARLLGYNGLLGVLGTDGRSRVWRSGEHVVAGDPAAYENLLPSQEQIDPLVTLMKDRWDGVVRYTARESLYDYPLAVVVGLSESEQLAAVRQATKSYLWRAAIGSGLLLALMLIVGRLSLQLSRSRARATAAEQRHAQRVEHLAYHDALTALPNRSLFTKLLGQAIRRAQRYQRKLAVAFIDLDRFKQINDTLGHEAGDQLLCEVATRLRGCLRDSDIVARLGGDEFVVLLAEAVEEAQVSAVAQKIVGAIAQPFGLLGQELCVTASIGISLYPQDGGDEQTLTKNADVAMYHAKESGRNVFRFYSGRQNSVWLERLELEAQLRHALQHREFELHYQARCELAGQRVSGAEALLRWRHPRRGWIAPAMFLPVAEETGLIVPLGRWVLQTACRQAMAWQRAGLPGLPIAVNVSARQLDDEQWMGDLTDALQSSGLAPGLLEIEIHESILLRDEQRARQLLAMLRSVGVRIAIDGFGAAYAALVSERPLPVDTLKISPAHIQGLLSRGGERTAEALIALGRRLSATVVAQGVETAAQAQALRARADVELQGFYFQRPMPAGQFAEELRRQRAGEPGLEDGRGCDQAIGQQ